MSTFNVDIRVFTRYPAFTAWHPLGGEEPMGDENHNNIETTLCNLVSGWITSDNMDGVH